MGHGQQAGDPAESHTMLVIGAGAVFVSHLPMFMKPHDYQVVLQVTFSSHGADPQRVYADDRAAHPDILLYTLKPKPFVLADLLPPSPGKPPRLRSFRADIFQGDVERPGAARIAPNVDVSVTGVVLGHKFVPKAPPLDHLTYVLFGKGTELWLAHVITGPPDFDQILSTGVDGHTFTDQDLGAGIPVTVPGRRNLGAERLTVAPGAAVPATATVAGKPVPVQLKPHLEMYFNDNDDLR